MAEDPKKTEAASKAAQDLKAAALDTTRAFQEQLRIMQQMQTVMQQLAGTMQQFGQQESPAMSSEKWDETTKAVEKANESMKGAAATTSKLANLMNSKLAKGLIVGGSALTGLYQGFKNIVAIGKGIFGVFSGLASGAFSIGKAILSIPFKMMDGLIGMAKQGGGGTELASAYENVRKEFGSLKSESSSTIISVAKGMGSLQGVGVSAGAIFGNLAERLEAVTKLATGMGASFQVFQGEIAKNGEAIMRYQKGLGLTDEQMGSLASNALRMGKDISEVQNEMTKQALGMSKAFGVNAKVISKDMGKAMQDLAHFGHLSTKELAVAATFANKLGVSVDKLTGIMDATATFDQAAEGMSKLNEQFGTNIDATEIMMEQNPAKKVEMLRKEFMKTGKDLANLSYQERMLIKQNSGLTDEMLNAAFSAKNAKVGLSDMEKAADKNEKAVMSQTKALRALSDSMERLVKSGETGPGGFFDHFFDGMKRGLMSSPEFLELMRNIRLSLREAMLQGVKLGRMFVDLFPGVKDVFGGLAEIFRPDRFREFFGGIVKAFDVFKEDGSGKMEDFMKKLQNNFFNFFDKSSPAGARVLGGFKKFGEAVAIIFGKISEYVVIKLSVIINKITDWLQNPKLPKVQKFDGMGRAIQDPFEKTLDALADNLGPALMRFVNVALEKIKEAFIGAPWEVQLYAGFKLFGPALSNTLGGFFSNWMKDKGIELIKQKFTGPLAEQLTKNVPVPDIKGMLSKPAATAVSQAGQAVETAVAAEGGRAASAAASAGAGLGLTLAAGVAAAAAGAYAGYKINEHLNEVAKKELDATIASNEKTLNEIQKISNPEERIAAAKKAQLEADKMKDEQMGFFADMKNMFFGEGDQLKLAADAAISNASSIIRDAERQKKILAQESIQGTAEWIAKQERDRTAAATAAQEKALKDLGPVTLDNAAERFKKIDELAKQVMGKDFDVQSKLDMVRKKLENINWSVVTPEKEVEVNKAVATLDSVRKVVSNIADIGGIISVAATKLETAGSSFDPKTGAYKALSSDGNIASAVKKAGETFSTIDMNAVKTGGINAGEAVTTFNKLIELSDASTKLADKMNTVPEETLTAGLTKTVRTVKKMVSTMQELEDALSKAGTSVKIETKLGEIAGKYGLGSADSFTIKKQDVVLNVSFNVTMDAGKVEKAIIMNKDSIIRDRINFALGAGTGRNTSVPQSLHSNGQGMATPAAPSVQ